MSSAVIWLALAVATVGHGVIWASIVNRLHGLAGPRLAIKVATAACAIALIAIPLALLADAWQDRAATFNPFALDHWTGYYARACVAVGVLGAVVKAVYEWRRYDRSVLVEWTADRREAMRRQTPRPLGTPYARLLCALPGNEALSLSVDRKKLAIPRLPAELAGATIAHLSDLHLTGRVGRDYFDYVVRTVNDLRPDAIAITGDVIECEACLSWLAPTLGRLCAPLGVYFILGNHDLFIDDYRTRQALVDEGLTCVTDRWIRADWNGASVTIAGNERPWKSAGDALDAPPVRGAATTGFRLALCHSPDQFSWCCRSDVDLALAGHTHGGQIQSPLWGPLAAPSLFGTRYACGVFRRGPTVLHVTRGVSGQTPLRWRCPPEIAMLELVRPAN